MRDLLSYLNITRKGKFSKTNTYIVDIESSEEYGVLFSKLDTDDKFTEIESTDNENKLTVRYEYKQFTISIIYDINKEHYYLEIKEN